MTVTASQAADINMTGWAFGNGQTVNVTFPTYDGEGGAFQGVLTNAGIYDTANLITYSVELTESFALPSNMTDYGIVGGTAYTGWGGTLAQRTARTNKIGKLMTYAYSDPTLVDSIIESGALQLAIWNAIYDTDNFLGSGTFLNSSNVGGVNAIANSFISNSLAVASQYNVLVLTKSGSTDFLLLQRVPTPGSLALTGLALALLWNSRRRSA